MNYKHRLCSIFHQQVAMKNLFSTVVYYAVTLCAEIIAINLTTRFCCILDVPVVAFFEDVR